MDNKTITLGIIGGLTLYFFLKEGEIIPMVNSKIAAMGRAIQEFEGWVSGSISQRNNNPGNLKFAGQPGAIGKDKQGHAMFDSYASGWLALLNQLRMALDGSSAVYHPDMNYYQFFGKYAEANSIEYANFVADKLGVNPQDTLRETLLT